MVDIFHDPRFLVALSTCFYSLAEKFDSTCRSSSMAGLFNANRRRSLEYLVIPSAFVDNNLTRALPAFTPKAQASLASQVYDHVYNRVATSGPYEHMTDVHPAIELEADVISSIPFDLTAVPRPHLMLQNLVLHVAYAFDHGRNWLVAFWTDSTGRYQAHRTYPLKHLSLHTILDEVWQSTHAIVNSEVGKSLRWRLIIVKCGCFIAEETKLWTDVIGEQAPHVSVWLVAVETDCKFSVSMSGVEQSVASELSNPSPTATLNSPSASTPGVTSDAFTSESDLNARIVDAADQTWGVLLAIQPNAADTPLLLIPSLQSALLVKRQTEHDCDPPAVLQVNLLKIILGKDVRDHGTSEYSTAVKEILRMYASLATLARLRGMEPRESVKPLHIAFVERALCRLEAVVKL